MDMDWSLPFCLACDRQTEGEVVREYEKACSSSGSSPQSPRVSTSWPTTKSKFYLPPAYNFNNPRQISPSAASPPASTFTFTRPQSSPAYGSKPVLTPSSSQSSLFSLRSNSSASQEKSPVSDEDRLALRDYERSFDQSRFGRRQSTH
ncbi:hypothetical protein BP5796_11101 [Coleophoma crateriformis]|uniref:Uncharacterized protein n=1 Tax=Coleophoma crateriformis TaxID=565419 RepID=A0A3D8QLX2_9HELO|nr:hypothetical protein BP5796_11101 [Coleophoma crateriformis]